MKNCKLFNNRIKIFKLNREKKLDFKKLKEINIR